MWMADSLWNPAQQDRVPSIGSCPLWRIGNGGRCYWHTSASDNTKVLGPVLAHQLWTTQQSTITNVTGSVANTAPVTSFINGNSIELLLSPNSTANSFSLSMLTSVRVVVDSSVVPIPSWAIWLALGLGIAIAVGVVGWAMFFVYRSYRRAGYEQL